MNKRLEQFLSAENISQAQFADSIDVARASVSHVLAGRNKPGYDFIKNIADHYPKLNLEWLISGKGKMYKENHPSSPASPFKDELFGPEEEEIHTIETENQPESSASAKSKELTEANKSTINQRNISKIIVLYDDNTYQELV